MRNSEAVKECIDIGILTDMLIHLNDNINKIGNTTPVKLLESMQQQVVPLLISTGEINA